jgi:hypothetical protein
MLPIVGKWMLRTRVRGGLADGISEYDAFISYSHALDGALARALQTGLEQFAKPWYRQRALRVCRDTTSLSADRTVVVHRASAGLFEVAGVDGRVCQHGRRDALGCPSLPGAGAKQEQRLFRDLPELLSTAADRPVMCRGFSISPGQQSGGQGVAGSNPVVPTSVEQGACRSWHAPCSCFWGVVVAGWSPVVLGLVLGGGCGGFGGG